MKYPSYTYPVHSLTTGSGLGNAVTFVRLTSESDADGLWSAIDNQYYLGNWTVVFECAGKLAVPAETVFYPESQSTLYDGGPIHIGKSFFIPYSLQENSESLPSEFQSLHCLVRLRNRSKEAADIVIRHRLVFPPESTTRFTKQPPADQNRKRFGISRDGLRWIITTAGSPDEVRIFGAGIPCTVSSSDERLLSADFNVHLEGGEERLVPFHFAYSPEGETGALSVYGNSADPSALLEESRDEYRRLNSRSDIRTPNDVINRGIAWAKINTVRVQHRYRAGWGFTNDPPQDIVVVRDLAWYVIGSDYLTPAFSRSILRLAEEFGYHSGGKLTEYFHANELPPDQHDYHLNINDDTPLYCYALYHHACAAGGRTVFEHIYPLMKRLCSWILSQRGFDGLVRCDTTGTNVWGICGWRNIIDGYTLSGAVTEVNAECYYALAITADVAARLGNTTEATYYRYHAEDLKQTINLELTSDRTGLYLLNSGNDGVDHHDITGDLVFPVMFGVAGETMRQKILATLTSDDLWGPYGGRTVRRGEPGYDPDAGYQLMGGLWPNLMAWTAYCLRRDQPDRLAEGMRRIYELCETECPAKFGNVVPGEFPERLHGETCVSMGMAMSPWMPPTYLWLAIEGLIGLQPQADVLSVEPSLPAGWNWLSVKNLVYRGELISLFFYNGVLYSTHPVVSSFPVKVGSPVGVSTGAPYSIALRVDGAFLLFAVSDEKWEGSVDLEDSTGRQSVRVSLMPNEAVLRRVPASPGMNQGER